MFNTIQRFSLHAECEYLNIRNKKIKEKERKNFTNFGNAYVHDCAFKVISGIENGGVIYFLSNNGNIKLLVELSSFNT